MKTFLGRMSIFCVASGGRATFRPFFYQQTKYVHMLIAERSLKDSSVESAGCHVCGVISRYGHALVALPCTVVRLLGVFLT